MSQPYKIFYDAKGNPVAKISETTLKCRFTDIDHLEKFYREELPEKPIKPLPGIRRLIEEAAQLKESEEMYVEDEIERITGKKTELELAFETTIESMRSKCFSI